MDCLRWIVVGETRANEGDLQLDLRTASSCLSPKKVLEAIGSVVGASIPDD